MTDYDRVTRVIQYLDENHPSQPNLQTLAGIVGLSESHFHRLFSRWAGITPKDFLQYLTAEHAKELLLNGASVLEATLKAGLSGPGRLHDLCVTLEAASPGEIKSGGKGLRLRYGVSDTPFGEWLVARNDRGICHISFLDDAFDAMERLRDYWPNAEYVEDQSIARSLAQQVFARTHLKEQEPLRAYVRGTAFQLKVWRALLQIPSGTLVTYSQVAKAAGHPSAVRAAGTAVGDNPLAFLIPCHRVIRQTGIIGNYRWGKTRKRSLLAWESARRNGIDLTEK